MSQLLVTMTRTGNEFHASTDSAKTLCGRKVTGTFGSIGTPIETRKQLPDGSWSDPYFKPAKITCEHCLEQAECDACGGIDPDCATCETLN